MDNGEEKTLNAIPAAVKDLPKPPFRAKVITRRISTRENIYRFKVIPSQPPTISNPAKLEPAKIQFPNIEPSVDHNLYCLPKDTKKMVTFQVDNYLLSLTKYAMFERNDQDMSKSGFVFFRPQSGGKQSRGRIANLPSKSSFQNIASFINRKRRIVKNLGGRCFEASTQGRLIVGLGEDNVHETGILLHFIQGLPYIPGSSIKGALRSYLIDKHFEGDEAKALKDQGFAFIFGKSNEGNENGNEMSGSIIFFDAFPVNSPTIVPDVMAVHYRKYYEKEGCQWPTDTENVVPILFPTVVNTTFCFCIAQLREKKDEIETKIAALTEQNVLETIAHLLQEALQQYGLGAKTAVGYGRFEEFREL